MQSQVPLPLIFLSCYTDIYSPSRSLCSSSDTHTLKIQRFNHKTHGFCTFSHFGPHIWNNLPQDIGHSATLFLQKPTQDIYLLRMIFQLNQLSFTPISLYSVCVCACQCIFCIIRVEHLSIYTFFNFKKINKIFHLDVHYACSALWALQISIIIMRYWSVDYYYEIGIYVIIFPGFRYEYRLERC